MICIITGAEDQVHIRAAISPRQGAAGPIAVHQTANEGYNNNTHTTYFLIFYQILICDIYMIVF